ncbi:MAG: type II secretion system protein GspM [Rhodopila sp.]|jgi:general secretion pathway protein M
MIPAAWRTGRPGQALAVGCGLLGLGLIWLGAVAPLWSWYADRQALLEQRQAMLVRIQGLAASLPALRAVSTNRHAAGAEVESGMLPGTTDAVAAAALQEAVQKMATTAGASLTAVETLPSTMEAERWRKISLRISLNAQWPVLVGLMRAVERSPSRIFIADVHFHSPTVVVRATNLPIQASMVLYGFRAADGGTRS